MCNRPDISDAVLAAVALVDFPDFCNVHDLIFEVFHAHAHTSSHRNHYTFDSQQWEIYLKYRQFLSGFLTNQRRSRALFVGPAHYIALAKCFWSFLVKETTMKFNPNPLRRQVLYLNFLIHTQAHAPKSFRMRNLKAVMLTFPHILPRCGSSVELSTLLNCTQLPKRPWFQKEWPGGDDWEALVHTLEQACQIYYKTVPKRSFLDRISSQITYFLTRD